MKIGSTKKIDSCGVCGGDGSTCSQPLYHWDIAPMSICSVTCGGGNLLSICIHVYIIQKINVCTYTRKSLAQVTIHQLTQCGFSHIFIKNTKTFLFIFLFQLLTDRMTVVFIGYKMSVPMCRNRLTGAEVEESLCNHALRPEPTVVQCNTHACPPK